MIPTPISKPPLRCDSRMSVTPCLSSLPCRVSLVLAHSDNGVIGRDNALPWHLPADLRHFRRLTMGHAILMGRRTFQSIGRPLPGRATVVLTRDPSWSAPGVDVAHDLPTAWDICARRGRELSAHPEIMPEVIVVGGAEIYAATLPLVQRAYITQVHVTVAGDAFAPPFPAADWHELSRESHPADGDCPAYSFICLERRTRPVA